MTLNKKLMSIKLAGLFAACLSMSPAANAAEILESGALAMVEGDAETKPIKLRGETTETETFFNAFISVSPQRQREKFDDFSRAAFATGVDSAEGADRNAALKRFYALMKESPKGTTSPLASDDELRGFYFYIIYRNSDEDFFESLLTEKWDTPQLAYIASDLGLYCLKYRPSGVCFRPQLAKKPGLTSPAF